LKDAPLTKGDGFTMNGLFRWLFLLPTALIASQLAELPGQLVVSLFAAPDLARYASLLLVYIPQTAAFVVVGALLAPERKQLTALVLALLAVTMALLAHLLNPQVVGLSNILHFSAESIGAGLGLYFFRTPRPRQEEEPSDVLRLPSTVAEE
jgi:hypothetical protein